LTCQGASDETCLYISSNFQDTEGSNTCFGACDACDGGGNCYFAIEGTDPGNFCPNSDTTGAYCGTSGDCVVIPNATEFDSAYGSTNLSNVSDLENVTNFTLATQYGKIQFPFDYGMNTSNSDYNLFVEIGAGFISVNTSELNPTFNSSANLTINNVICPATIYYGSGVYSSSQDIVSEANICSSTTDPECTNINCNVNNVTFTVSHFTGFATSVTANLTIWDETDSGMPYADQTKYANEQVKFYANYTNSSGEITDADCVINFTDSSDSMAWNATTKLYEYNRSFSNNGILSWNATCNKTGYNTLTANDTVNITNIPPETPYVFINATEAGETTVDDLICWANTTDADADNVSYEGFWYRNGVQNTSFTTWPNKYPPENLTNVSILDSGRTYSGEEWSCRVRAYDSHDYSNYSSSENLTVQPLYTPTPSTGGGGTSSRGTDECGSGEIACINGSSSAFCAYDLVENRWKWFEVKCGQEEKCVDGACIPLECKEDWVCDEWGLCINGIQERDCFEWGHCGTQEFKPAEQRECVIPKMPAEIPKPPAIEPPFKPPIEEIPAVVPEEPAVLPLWASLLLTAAGLIIIISAAARIYISSRIGAVVVPKLRNLRELEHINRILQNMNSRIKEHTIKIKKFRKGGKNA